MANMIASLKIIVPALIVSTVMAEDSALFDGQAQSNGKGGDRGDLNLNKAYLELFYNKEDIRRIRSKSEIIDKELEGVAGFSESYKPLEKNIQTVDKIYLHPKRSVTVMLPKGAMITRITPTFDTKFIEYDEANPTNLFTILSMPAFVSGDLTVYYTLNDQKYVMKLVCEKYSQNEDTFKTYHAVIAYRQAKILPPFDVLEAYRKEYGSYPGNQYSFVSIDGVAYKIIEDALYGALTAPNGKKYRIETQTNQRN